MSGCVSHARGPARWNARLASRDARQTPGYLQTITDCARANRTRIFFSRKWKSEEISRARSVCLWRVHRVHQPHLPTTSEGCSANTTLSLDQEGSTVLGGAGGRKQQMRAKCVCEEKKGSELTRNHAAGWTQLRTPRHGGGLGATSRARLAGGCPQPTPFNAHCATGRTKKTDGKKSVERGKRVGVLGVYNAAHWIDLRLRRSVRVCMVIQHRPFTECYHLNSRRYRQLPHLKFIKSLVARIN